MGRTLLRVISRLTQVISSDADLHHVFQTFSNELRELVNFDRLSVCIIEGAEFRVYALASKMETDLTISKTYPLQDSPVGWVAKHKRTNIERDFRKHRDFPIDDIQAKAGLCSAIRVPLFLKGEVFGSISLLSSMPYAYGERERRILKLLASQIAGPIEISRAYEALQRSLSLSQAILGLIKIAGAGLHTDEFRNSFASNLRKLVPFNRASINLLDKSRKSVRIIVIYPLAEVQGSSDCTVTFNSSYAEWVTHLKENDLKIDVSGNAQTATLKWYAQQGYRSVLRTPLYFENQSFGSFDLSSFQTAIYSGEEQELVEQICTMFSYVIWYQRLAQLEKQTRLELEEQDKARAQFVSVLAHELRSALTPISGCARMLSKESPREVGSRNDRLVGALVSGTQVLEARLSDLLDLAQYQAGAFALALETVDIMTVIEEVTSYFQPLAESKRQSLTVDLPVTLPLVRADKQRLRQVLMNLLENSVKYTPEGGKIRVKATDTSHDLTVRVSNNGQCLSVEEQQRLFQPYWRSEVDRQRFPGTGLGLHVCKKLIEAHGGRIWVESQSGEGSTFAFSIPLDGS